jgi:hypothetical protein
MKIELPSQSYIEYSVDIDTQEVIIDDIKSFQKGDGTKLAQAVIDIYNAEYADNNYSLTLYAYPQDDTIDQENLVKFWESVGFEVDSEQGGDGVMMTY